MLPVSIECLILFIVAIWGQAYFAKSPNIIACSLLFSIGLQNSMVTSISNASVRTTHHTGLFTDLGIKLSQLFFYKAEDQKLKLLSSIKLRLTIISFFFIGGVIGGLAGIAFVVVVLLVVRRRRNSDKERDESPNDA